MDWRDPAEREHERRADMTAQVVWEREQAELIAGLRAKVRELETQAELVDDFRRLLAWKDAELQALADNTNVWAWARTDLKRIIAGPPTAPSGVQNRGFEDGFVLDYGAGPPVEEGAPCAACGGAGYSDQVIPWAQRSGRSNLKICPVCRGTGDSPIAGPAEDGGT